MDLSTRIKAARKEKRLTQPDLADELGVSYMTVRRWETGKASPRIKEIEKLSKVLNIPMEYFMSPDDAPPQAQESQNIPININNTPEVSNDDLDLSYWGGVAERASRAARSGDVQKLAAISLMLKLAQEAVEAVNDGENEKENQRHSVVGIEVRGDKNNVRNNQIDVRR